MNRKFLINILKIAFVLALLYYLAQRGFLSLNRTKSAFEHWDLLAPAFVALFLTTLLSVVRWQLLLGAQRIHLHWLRSLQLTMVGNFFNIALPGAVTGDVVKAIYVGKEVPGRRAYALSSILFDRVAGVSGLVLVSATALLISRGEPWNEKITHAIQAIILALATGVVGFFVYLFLVSEKRDPLLSFLSKIEHKAKVFTSFRKIYEGLREYHGRKGTVLITLSLSVLIHCFVIYACTRFTLALDETSIPFAALYALVPLGLIFTAIPISPAGVGTGHAAFLALYSLMGSANGADVFSLFVLYNLFTGAVGGLIYLQFKSKIPTTDLDLASNEAK